MSWTYNKVAEQVCYRGLRILKGLVMAQYRKKPIVVEAEQYQEFGKLVRGMCNSQSCLTAGNIRPHVHTIHKGQIVNLELNDWVIPESDGEHFYPCKPDIFEATYELVEPNQKGY